MAERPWKLNDTFPLSLAMEEEAAAVEGAWGFYDTVPLSLAQTFTAAAGESAGEFWSLWEQAFNEAEAGGAPEIFAEGAAVLSLIASGTAVLPVASSGSATIVLIDAGAGVIPVGATGAGALNPVGAGTAVLPVAAQGAATLQLQNSGTALLDITAAGAATLQLQGAGTGITLGEILAEGAAVLQLIGAGTATVTDAEPERIAEYWRGGAGREEFQPRIRRRPRPIEAAGAGKLVLIGRGRAVTTPELAKGFSPSPKQKPLERPPEELREFRILARGRAKLQLRGSGEAQAAIQARGHSRLALVGAGEIVKSWPDDTDELVAIMLMLDNEAA